MKSPSSFFSEALSPPPPSLANYFLIYSISSLEILDYVSAVISSILAIKLFVTLSTKSNILSNSSSIVPDDFRSGDARNFERAPSYFLPISASSAIFSSSPPFTSDLIRSSFFSLSSKFNCIVFSNNLLVRLAPI